MKIVYSLQLRFDEDVVAARQRTREIARLLRYETSEQTRLAAAASEIVRNAIRCGNGGLVEFCVEVKANEQYFVIKITDRGSGTVEKAPAPTGEVLSGIDSARRLVDKVEVQGVPGQGTTVALRRRLPRGTPPLSTSQLQKIAAQASDLGPKNPVEEMQQQNRDLVRTLEELTRVNNELAETNRGVVALYAELEDKAERLRKADEVKSRFLAYMSHEFRTPVNSTISLARLLLSQTDGELSEEQEKQVQFIKKAQENLLELINDLLDLAKVEAGKIAVTPVPFKLSDVFSGLRGMFRPLMANNKLSLVIEDPSHMPELFSDEGKIAQIIRNFISNALKFTERGEVRVGAKLKGDFVHVFVKDTGIGIAPEDQCVLFEEFRQVSNRLQKRSKGTGLGLSLSRKLAELLGGRVGVESKLGIGSVFFLEFPRRLTTEAEPVQEHQLTSSPTPQPEAGKQPVLVVEDQEEAVFLYKKYLAHSEFSVIGVNSLAAARAALKNVRPAAIVLDILLKEGSEAWSFLTEIKGSPETAEIPVIVASVLEEQQKGFALGAADYCVKPVQQDWLLKRLLALTQQSGGNEVMVVDDDESSRYLLKNALSGAGYEVIEAKNGEEALEIARSKDLSAIFLDLIMPGMSGFEVLQLLRASDKTKNIPVIISTSKILTEAERSELKRLSQDLLSKEEMSHLDAISYVGNSLRQVLTRAEGTGGPQ